MCIGTRTKRFAFIDMLGEREATAFYIIRKTCSI